MCIGFDKDKVHCFILNIIFPNSSSYFSEFVIVYQWWISILADCLFSHYKKKKRKKFQWSPKQIIY